MIRIVNISAALIGMFIITTNPIFGQEEETQRFSHKGIKVALGTGSFEVTSERDLGEGEGGFVSLGYGASDRFSLWITLMGAEHTSAVSENRSINFGGIELNLQHRFQTVSRFQPYGKVGVGVYGLEEKGTDVSLIGAGVNLGLGVDFFFAKHFGVGLEALYKKLDYFKESISTPDGDLVRDVRPQLNGDTVAVFLTFTIQ